MKYLTPGNGREAFDSVEPLHVYLTKLLIPTIQVPTNGKISGVSGILVLPIFLENIILVVKLPGTFIVLLYSI